MDWEELKLPPINLWSVPKVARSPELASRTDNPRRDPMNPVAKHSPKFNKPKVYKDRKKEMKRGTRKPIRDASGVHESRRDT